MLTYTKYFQLIDKSKVREEIVGFVGADCWGVYMQKQNVNWLEHGCGGATCATCDSEKIVYFDTIALDDKNKELMKLKQQLKQQNYRIRDELCLVNSKTMNDVIEKMNDGYVLTIVMFGDQSAGDISVFKVDHHYVWFLTKKDE